jgi:hypothetical protein
MCKGPHAEEDLIPEWAVCRGGSGKDEEPGIQSDTVGDPATPPAGEMDNDSGDTAGDMDDSGDTAGDVD